MSKKVFGQSGSFREEYSALICRVGKVTPLENSDFLASVNMSGFDIIVRKDQVKEGDIKIYCPIETELCAGLLSANNLYSISHKELNSNAKEVTNLVENGETDKAKSMVGFFDERGRIRMLRLRGHESMGFIMNPEDLLAWKPKTNISDIANHVGESFDSVDGEIMIKVYMPPIKPVRNSGTGYSKHNKVAKHVPRIIPGTFAFHYDTMQLERYMMNINPETVINISEKMDGTSFILSNIPVLRKLSFIEKIKKFFGAKVVLTDYDMIYSSRHVIKNGDLNASNENGSYSKDVYGDIAKHMHSIIPKGMTVYGECIGYYKEGKAIQNRHGHAYSYGCNVGECKIMPYRITKLNSDGKHEEIDVNEIVTWVKDTLKDNPALKDYLVAPTVFYNGPAMDLYKDIVPSSPTWKEDFLSHLKADKNMLMECEEPTCSKGTPSEGIVIRIDKHPELKAYKLKCLKYRELEAKDIDKGIVDTETAESYPTSETAE